MGWKTAALMAWGASVAVFDARTRRLPNALTLGAVVVATGYLLLHGRAPTDATVASTLLAASLALAFTLPAYVLRWLGGGDVKLAFAVGLLGGTQVFLGTIAVGGLLLGAMLVPVWRFHVPGTKPQRVLPYGTAHGIGFMVSVAAVQWLPGLE